MFTKKLMLFFMAVLSAVLLTACGGQSAAPKTSAAPGSEATVAAGDKAPAPMAVKAGGKTLVVYYSATGRTKTAAEAIAAAMGGDLFELVPQQPYTTADLDYNNKDSRVSREHDAEDDSSRRERKDSRVSREHEDASQRHVALVKDAPDNFASYETIFVGYPIWWGGAAWIVDDFVKYNDFTGKTMIPFATSYSSPMGSSGRDLVAMAGTGNWQEGACFDRDMTRDAVMTWAKGLK